MFGGVVDFLLLCFWWHSSMELLLAKCHFYISWFALFLPFFCKQLDSSLWDPPFSTPNSQILMIYVHIFSTPISMLCTKHPKLSGVTCSWIPWVPHSMIAEFQKQMSLQPKPGRSSISIYDLASEVIEHHIHYGHKSQHGKEGSKSYGQSPIIERAWGMVSYCGHLWNIGSATLSLRL